MSLQRLLIVVGTFLEDETTKAACHHISGIKPNLHVHAALGPIQFPDPLKVDPKVHTVKYEVSYTCSCVHRQATIKNQLYTSQARSRGGGNGSASHATPKRSRLQMLSYARALSTGSSLGL